jgi:hypothetical protein
MKQGHNYALAKKKMLKENPPKDDKGYKDKKDKTKKRSGQEDKDKKTKIRRTTKAMIRTRIAEEQGMINQRSGET